MKYTAISLRNNVLKYSTYLILIKEYVAKIKELANKIFRAFLHILHKVRSMLNL